MYPINVCYPNPPRTFIGVGINPVFAGFYWTARQCEAASAATLYQKIPPVLREIGVIYKKKKKKAATPKRAPRSEPAAGIPAANN